MVMRSPAAAVADMPRAWSRVRHGRGLRLERETEDTARVAVPGEVLHGRTDVGLELMGGVDQCGEHVDGSTDRAEEAVVTVHDQVGSESGRRRHRYDVAHHCL